MKKVTIITDNTSDLTKDLYEKLKKHSNFFVDSLNEIYDIVCDVEDLESPREKLCLDIKLDAPLLVECFYGCLFEFTEIRILDRIA